jgi:DNA-binding PadR family transcriptional regulator
MSQSNQRGDILHGTQGLLELRKLLVIGPQHGYSIARRVDETSGNMLELIPATLSPALLHVEQMGWISSKCDTSANNRRGRFYSITAAGRKQLENETRNWKRAAEIIARFPAPERASL